MNIILGNEYLRIWRSHRTCDGHGGSFVRVPIDIRKVFGKGRVKVHATFNNVPYNGSVVNMGVKNADGSICYILGMPKAIRQQLHKQPGDWVHITLTPTIP